MRLLHQIGSPRKNVIAAISENDQVVLLCKPQAHPDLIAPLVAPYFYRRVVVMFDDRPWPAYPLATPEVRGTIFFNVSFLDHVPKGRLLAMRHRMAFETEPPPLEHRLAVDEILLEPLVNGIQIGIPFATVITEQNQRLQPTRCIALT